MAEQTVLYEQKQSKPVVFYLGVFFNVFGVCLIVVGIFTDRWVVLSEAHDAVPGPVRLMLTSHFGPWKACRHSGQCGSPWDIVAGLEKLDLKLVHLLLSMAAVLHFGGLVTLLLKCWRLCINWTHWFIDKFNNFAVAEFLLGTATMLTTIAVFVMGHVKRKVILRHHQLEATGYSFLITLVGILLVVCGITLMALNSTLFKYSRLSDHTYRFLIWLDNLCVLQQKSQTARENAHPDSTITSQSPESTITCVASVNVIESLNAQTVVTDTTSDSQRPEDDFLLQNTRGPDGPEICIGFSKYDQYDHQKNAAVIPSDIKDKPANKTWISFEETEDDDEPKSLQRSVLTMSTCSQGADDFAKLNKEYDIPSYNSQVQYNSSGKICASLYGTEDNDKTKDPQKDNSSNSTDSQGPAGIKSKIPERTTQKSTNADNQSNKSSILQTAKRYATDTFMRPFQSPDRIDKNDEENSYPGNSGISVLKFVDV